MPRIATRNHGFEYHERVTPAAEGRSVLAHLTQRHNHSTREQWRARIAAGEVAVDGRVAQPDQALRRAQRLTWRRPPWVEPAVPLSFAMLYRDDDLLAVAKPRGLPSVPGGGFLEHTLLRRVRRTWRSAVPLHRLGRGTSGVMLFALSGPARRGMAAAWREGGVERVYRALVRGCPERETFRVDAPIGPVAHPRLGTVCAAAASGKRALSRVRVLGRRGADSLVEVRIDTGRAHQIRIHLAVCGHPLAGDPVYAPGGGLLPDPGLPGDGGYWLHAHRLGFAHPASGARLELECPPPAPLL